MFKSIRLSYLDDLDKNPNIQKAIELLNITGFTNYTPEIVAKLNEMGYDVAKDVDRISWFNKNGQLHRDNNLPAREDSDGYCEWRIEGNYHRTNGPARISLRGEFIEWFKFGQFIGMAYNPGDYQISIPGETFHACSFEEYKNQIEKEFPEANGAINIQDWI